MTTDSRSDYVRAARKRWPQATVEGDGSFALVSYCPQAKHVRLYELYLEAAALVAQPCPHAFCKREHRLFRIAPMQEMQPQQFAHSVGYGK